MDLYVAAFAARCAARRRPGQPAVDEPGIGGLLEPARLMVTDDRAYDVLAGLDLGAGVVTVLAGAPRCAALLGAWTAKPLTAMVCRDLRTLPAAPLPAGLVVRPVRRRDTDPAGGVPLHDAVAAALRADPSQTDLPDAFASYLRSLPGVRLLAAVDSAGAVRATAGFGVAADVASAFFINTDPDWRGRGVARAMTAVALRAARDAGARSACLDATGAGRSIYARLGFEAVGDCTQFVR